MTDILKDAAAFTVLAVFSVAVLTWADIAAGLVG